MYTLKDLQRWADDVGKYSSESNIQVHKGSFDSDQVHFYIYTNDHMYSITANNIKGGIGGHSYLGCIASSRKPRAGETWTRGNDLADGDLTLETWNRILGDIVSYELVRVHSPRKNEQVDLNS